MSQAPSIRIDRIGCALDAVLPQAAAGIVERERGRLPDLSQVVVVVPHLHAANDVARELRTASARPVLLLPRITTLRDWASQVPAPQPVATRAQREALLYQVLAQRKWLAPADLWAIAAELAALFEEITRGAVVLPATVDEFARQLERAYRARRGAALEFEARMVHELWHVLAADAAALDPEAAYQLQLARLGEQAAVPLYAVGLAQLARAEEAFLAQYARRAPVTLFVADPGAGGNAVSRSLAAAWPREAGHADLRSRAQALREAVPAGGLAGRLALCGAASPEQEAQAVDVAVREWLLAGRQRIAIVVHDRLVARRARALLERAQVLVKDEAGWAFSTTSAATVIGRWLDLATADCYHRDLLDLLKSPFAFHDWQRAERQSIVWRLERLVRSANIVSGLPRYIALAEENGEHEVRQLLMRVQRGLAHLGRGRRTLAQWLAALNASLAEIGVLDGFAADSAGTQLTELLAQLARELEHDRLQINLAEWRRWLARELESATFRDRTIESPVVFTNLAAARLRRFDAVLILGADAQHLPGPEAAELFFNQRVRADLGLPTRADQVRELEDALAGVIASGGSVLVTWQRLVNGEANLLSPHFERLTALHELAYGVSLHDETLLQRLSVSQVMLEARGPAVLPTVRPAPGAERDLLPQRISASGYNTLVACPYQFHARFVLRLAQLDDVQEMIEKADYGQRVHDVLHQFHAAHPKVRDLEPAAAQAELEQMSEAAFAADVGRNYLAQAWLARWHGVIPEYLAWQREWEAAGWTWHAGEATREVVINTPQGARVTLRGRIDRIDAAGDGAVAVIDYKTQRRDTLRKKVEAPGEDVQLPVYALLWGNPVTTAQFLSLERDGVDAVDLGPDVMAVAASERDRLGSLFDQMRAGAPMPAHGVDAVCDYCEMRGLCRRNYWP